MILLTMWEESLATKTRMRATSINSIYEISFFFSVDDDASHFRSCYRFLPWCTETLSTLLKRTKDKKFFMWGTKHILLYQSMITNCQQKEETSNNICIYRERRRLFIFVSLSSTSFYIFIHLFLLLNKAYHHHQYGQK